MLNFDNPDIYKLVVEVSQGLAIDPDISEESEQFFRRLLSDYTGSIDTNAVIRWLKQQIPIQFVALGDRPRWIQGAEWPFANGQPMIFAGQIDLTKSMGEQVIPNFYHDDTSLYVFIGYKVEPIVILQQF